MTNMIQIERDVFHGHLFCGLGAGAKGFNRGTARVGNMRAKSICVGGIDVDPAACRDFEKLAGVKASCLDLFTLEQYVAFHGKEPPRGWRPAMPSDISCSFGGRRPHIVFLSAPCKGFSGLLPEASSKSAKYQALNGLTLRGLWLLLEEYKDDPVELLVFENVPRIATRGRYLLDQIIALLRSYGYAVAETTHDCGVLGGLGQSRKRFLLVARHEAKVPAFLYEPPKHPLRGVGEILSQLPMPLSGDGGAMHRMPALQWKTWVRLAFVRAGADWRSLNDLAVDEGYLRDYGIVPSTDWHRGIYGVRKWDEPSGAVTSRGTPACGAFAVADPREIRTSDGSSAQSVADPRVDGHPKSVQLGVRPWNKPAGVVTGKMFVGGGPNAVADPRTGYKAGTHHNIFRIIQWDSPAGAVCGHDHVTGGAASVADVRFNNWHPNASSSKLRVTSWNGVARSVTGSQQVGSGAGAVADPRPPDGGHGGKYRVSKMDEPAGTVISASTTGNGAFAVADPRPEALAADTREDFLTGGHYGVVDWKEPSGAVSAHAKNNNGRWSLADPRPYELNGEKKALDLVLPAPSDRLVCVIHSPDNTWHRPFTTLELAALQGMVDPEEKFELDGLSDSSWRERIGNAVPPPSAQAIASVMFETLLLSWSGQTFALSNTPIWVRDVAAGLSIKPQEMPSW